MHAAEGEFILHRMTERHLNGLSADAFRVPVFDPAPFVPPRLLSGDVRGLRALLDQLLRNHPMTASARSSLMAILARLNGDAVEMPPSIGEALAVWLTTLTDWSDTASIEDAGRALMAAVMLSGDSGAADRLLPAMERIVDVLHRTTPGATVATPARVESETAADALEWTEPNIETFYALDQRSGRELAAILDDLRNQDRYLARGAPAPNRLLFDGAAGCGKTSGARWLAAQLGKPLATIMLAALISKYIGETGARFAAAVEAARARDAVLLIDELDTVGGHREQAEGGASDHTAKVVGAINQTLDRMPDTMTIIGATNLPDAVDPSVARRLRHRVHFHAPDREAREVMVAHHWRKAPHEADALAAIVNRTAERSGDLVERVAHDANRRAARRAADAAITVTDVIEALASMPREAGLGEARNDRAILIG